MWNLKYKKIGHMIKPTVGGPQSMVAQMSLYIIECNKRCILDDT